jgi:orotidine-5'-phosphate decarboxylase
MRLLKKTIDYIPNDIHVIGDAKRGDIGNTSKAYAKAVFEEFGCDSVTVSPYMGSDSIKPFLSYNDKMVFLLCLTSNPGSNDFEKLKYNEKNLYEHVLEKSSKWGTSEQLGYVVGATHSSELKNVREQAPDRYFLIPGVGAQGGNPAEVMKSNMNGPAIINSSRGIIYAGGDSKDFAEKSRQAAMDLRNKLINTKNCKK